MLEAWLLFDADAIRRAAGNPHGTQQLTLPPLTDLENLPHPKAGLHQALRHASGLHGRRLRSFNPHIALHRIPQFIEDFSPLRALCAFQRLESSILGIIHSSDWS
jgi:hypothetical protein